MRINNKNKQTASATQQTTTQPYSGQINDSNNAYSALAQSLEEFGNSDYDTGNFDEFGYMMQTPSNVTNDMAIPLTDDIQQMYNQQYDPYNNLHTHTHNTMYPNYSDDIQYYNSDEFAIPQTSSSNIQPNLPDKQDLLKTIAEEALIEPDQSSDTSSVDSQVEVSSKRRKIDCDTSASNLPTSTVTTSSKKAISKSDYDRISKKPVATRVEPIIEDVNQKNKKNAIQARVNRQRKKNELQLLETKVAELQAVNTRLTSENSRLTSRHDTMAEELVYLRNILRNQSSISKVIQGISGVTELKISKKFTSPPVQVDLADMASRLGSGVCIHVDNTENGSQVSLELCKECSKASKSSQKT